MRRRAPRLRRGSTAAKPSHEAAIEPTKSLFVNMDAAMLKLAMGEPASTESVTLVNVPYEAWVYPWFTAYIKDGKIATWSQTQWVIEDAPAKAIEAYNKAYEMAPKTADKVKEGLKQISDFCSQVGNTGIDTGNYADAADAYALVRSPVQPRSRQSRNPRCSTMRVTCARWTALRTPLRSSSVPIT
ncbi:MAG: hypothetical protein ACLRSE_12650 [Alistipes finegoldii]